MTGQTLIDRALRLIDQLATGYSASAADSAACLSSLNEMLAIWSAEQVMVYTITEDFLVPDGSELYTWGSAGDLTTTRPMRILSARTVLSSISRPVEILRTLAEWDTIVDRSATGSFVHKLFYDADRPVSGMYTWPLVTGGVLYIHSLKALTAISALGDTISFPAGYEHALVHNLAVRVAPDFRRQIPELVLKEAERSKAVLATLNVQVLGTGGN